MDKNVNEAFSWERLAQFHLIEVIAFWEGRLTSNHLQTAFSIGRSKASDIIKLYQQAVAGNIRLGTHRQPATPYPPSQSRCGPRYSDGCA